MDGYMFLKPYDAHIMRVERIRELETDHYRALLLLEETPGDDSTIKTVKELERRHAHHVGVLHSGAESREAPSSQPTVPSEASAEQGE